MARNKIDFRDKELYCVALALSTHISSREIYWTKKSAANFKRMLKKVIAEGMERKDPKSILHPIVEFEDEQLTYESKIL